MFVSTLIVSAAPAGAFERADRQALDMIRRNWREAGIAGEWAARAFDASGRVAFERPARVSVRRLSIDVGFGAETVDLAADAATGALAGTSAGGTAIALAVDVSGLEAAGTWSRGLASGDLGLRRDLSRLESLSAGSIDLPAARVAIDLAAGDTPFAQAIKERAVAALTVTAQIPAVPVVLSKDRTACALDSLDWYYLSRRLAEGKVPGATFSAKKAVLAAVLNDAIAQTAGRPTAIRDMTFASLLLRRGVPFDGIMYLYVTLKDTLSLAHGEGVEIAIDAAHRSRIVSTKDVVAYMNSLDHGLYPTSYPKYFADLHAVPAAEADALFGALLDLSLEGRIDAADLAAVGPRGRACAIDYAGVLGAELYRVFIKTPEPVVRGELIVPFAQNMIETTLLSAYTRLEREIVVANVTTPSALPVATLDLLPETAGSYWVAEHDFTPRLADRRLLQRLLTEWLRTADGARLRELETLIGAKKKDFFQDLSVYIHRASRADVTSGAAARASDLARELLRTLAARAPEARAFVGQKVAAANAIFAARALPNFGDLWWKHTLRNLHAFWATLPAAERRTLAAGFDRHLRERLSRDLVRGEIVWSDARIVEWTRAAAGAGADAHAVAYVCAKLAWTAPQDAAVLAEAKARIESASHPRHAATAAAARALLDRMAARADISKAVGFSTWVSDELYYGYKTSWTGVAPDLKAKGATKIVGVKAKVVP